MTMGALGAGPQSYFDRPISFLTHYLRRRMLRFFGLFALATGAAACSVGVQYGMKLLVDAMARPGYSAVSLWNSFGIFLILIVTESVLWRLSGIVGSETVIATGVEVRLDLFEHLSGHSMRYFSDRLAGGLGNRITGIAGNFGGIINQFTWNITPPCVDFLGALILFSLIDWRMAGALQVFVLIIASLLTVFGLRCRPLHARYAEMANVVSGELIDTIANIWSIKAFSARGREKNRLAEKFGMEGKAQRQSWRCIEKTRVLHDVSLWVMAGSMLAWAVTLWQKGRITPGDVVVISALTFRILHGSRDLALALIGMTQNFGFISETLQEIGRIHEVVDPSDMLKLIDLGGSIAFEDVSFAYPSGRRVLSRFDLAITAGQKVGIVGPSGAGKSTLLNLVQRLHDPQSGMILIDGQPITGINQDSLRDGIAVVPQEISLFHRTVMDNIRYGRPAASDEEVVAAARAAYCDAFIQELPQGYDTIVGERGANLSGGQRQRIGVARAFLKDAPILILDEATSALDTESEILIQQALAILTQGRSVLAVAHRLSTLISFDRIIVLMDGKCIEDGSPGELLSQGGVFTKICWLQGQGLTSSF